jgi:hypothetical protein
MLATHRSMVFSVIAKLSGGSKKRFKLCPNQRGDDTQLIWPALFNAMRKKKPFPITINEAVEVVRVTEVVRKMNGQ